jgi:hypothetical protein
MGHHLIGEHHAEPGNIVSVIEGIIHDPMRLDAFRHEARDSLRENGLLPQTRIWDYLHWRRDLDPSRFDHYHPEFVHLFRWEEWDIEHMPRHQPATVATGVPGIPTDPKDPIGNSIGVPPGHQSWTPPGHQSGVPPSHPPGHRGVGAVPEPSSLVLAVTAIAVAAIAFANRWVRIGPFARPARRMSG